ncbi:MAG: hypothetical protein CBD16_04380 [Betaproteobacteria bacterium TMED156]|nr:MAG: hypothetical protein CBD16_04380 [Betaproteobacteria bacterium TMED156]
MPGLVASASKNTPRLFIILIIFSILGFGLFDRSPWRGTDLFGTALIKSCVDAYYLSSLSCIVPNFYGSIFASEGPLFTWSISFLILSINFLLKVSQLEPISINYFDDLARIIQSFYILIGLSILWIGTKTLALRRESKPIDPLGIGPTSEKFSSNIADCSVLITISCLGLIMPWHEVGKTGLNFLLFSTIFYSLSIAPEKPKKAGAIFGVTSLAVLFSSGIGVFIFTYLASLIICFRTYPWYLVGKTFHSYSLFFLLLGSLPFFFIEFKAESISLIKIWVEYQTSQEKFQPFFLIKTWLWTWWPLWPIVTAFAIQAYREKFIMLSHLQMPLILLFMLTLFPLSGVFVSEGVKFIPIVPLAVLAAFGLLSLPRSVANLLDYFALSIFTFLSFMIWMYWIALHTGTPDLIYKNVIKAAPNISGKFNLQEIILGIVVSCSWVLLIVWRIRVSEPMIWRPVILSAGGLGLTWVLLINLWGPALEVNRGFTEITREVTKVIKISHPNISEICIGINHNDLKTRAIVLANSELKINKIGVEKEIDCEYMMIRSINIVNLKASNSLNLKNWNMVWSGNREADPRKKENFLLYKKIY